MKKLIYTTDFSKNSVAALNYAAGLSKLLDAELIVLHIAEKVEKENEKAYLLQKHKDLEAFTSLHLESSQDDLDISWAVRMGNPKKQISGFIKDLKFDLLIMGTAGLGAVERFFLGSTVRTLMTNSTVPVLVVPPNYQYKHPTNLLYASDYEQEDIFHIGKLIQLFKPEPVKIVVVHISNEDELMIKNLLGWFKQSLQEKIKYEHLDFSVIFSEDRLKGLQTVIKRNSADLVVILERAPRPERSGIFYNDLVQELQSKIKIPVLSYNETY
ncbi:universal stress protein [Salegentibacter sp. HM20]